MLLVLSLLFITTWLFYKYVNHSYFKYWKNRGVVQIDGSFPVGSSPNIDLSTRYQGYNIQYYYNELSPHPFGGFYNFIRPQILVRDPNLIQHVMIKDFSYFRNRSRLRNDTDDIFQRQLFGLEGDKWRALRVKLTPTFSSGKLKQMITIFEECSKELLDRIREDTKMSETLDVKELTSRFTMDLIVTCAFGLELNTLKKENTESAMLTQIGKAAFPKAKTWYRCFLIIMNAFAPFLFKRAPSVLPNHLEHFLTYLISNTIEYREKYNVKRHDFLNLLIELRNKGHLTVEKGDEKEVESSNEKTQDFEVDLKCIVAQCFVFFLAGYETSSSVQTGALFELAFNQDIQDRLRQEIKETKEKNDGEMTYQAILEMKYLDQVVKETMRKYPTIPILTRVCVKKYKMPESEVVIDEGTKILIPVYGLHHDPNYFPEPDKFDPERFSEANEGKINPCTYLPFGTGPRGCIGIRFGLLQTKIGLITILSDFKVSPSRQTVNPMQFSATPLVSSTTHSVLLKFDKL